MERIYYPPEKLFAEQQHGVMLVRGENVVLLGEVDMDEEDMALESWHQSEMNILREKIREEVEKKKIETKRKLSWIKRDGTSSTAALDLLNTLSTEHDAYRY